MMDKPAQLIIDDECTLCRVSASWLVRADALRRASIVGARSLDDEALRTLGLTRAQLTDAAWLVDAQGVTRGADAVLRVLATRGRWSRSFGRVLALPPLRSLAHRTYHVVARHRRSLSRPLNQVLKIARTLRAKKALR